MLLTTDNWQLTDFSRTPLQPCAINWKSRHMTSYMQQSVHVMNNRLIITSGHATNCYDRPHRRGIFHWENTMWHPTASVTGQPECWSTARGKIPTSCTATGNGARRRAGRSKVRLPVDDLDPHLMHSSRVHTSPHPKRHFDRFSRFARLTIVTDTPRYSVCSNWSHLAIAAMRPDNNNVVKVTWHIGLRPHRHRRRTVQSYSPGCANMPSHVGTLAPPGE